jgi:hypothetical protein
MAAKDNKRNTDTLKYTKTTHTKNNNKCSEIIISIIIILITIPFNRYLLRAVSTSERSYKAGIKTQIQHKHNTNTQKSTVTEIQTKNTAIIILKKVKQSQYRP